MTTELKFGPKDNPALEALRKRANEWANKNIHTHWDRMKLIVDGADKEVEVKQWLGETIAVVYAMGLVDGQRGQQPKKTRIVDKDGKSF